MSKILRDHRRLVGDVSFQQSRKRNERQGTTLADVNAASDRRLKHGEVRKAESREHWDRSDQFWAKRDASLNKLYDRTALQGMARGELDPRAHIAETDAGAQAFQRVRPELTGGAPAAAGGAPGAPGGAGAGTPMGDRPSREEFLKQVAHYQDTTGRQFAPEKIGDTGEKIDPAMQAYHAAERDFTEYDKRYAAQQAGAPPTAPEFHAAKAKPGEGVSIARGEDDVTYATDAVMPDTVVGSAIRNAFKDLSPEETQASIERMPEGHRGMAGRTAQGVQAGRASSEPYGGAGHPTPQGFSTPVPTKKGGEDRTDAAGTTPEGEDVIDVMLDRRDAAEDDPGGEGFLASIGDFVKRVSSDLGEQARLRRVAQEVRQAGGELREKGVPRNKVNDEIARVREKNPDLNQFDAAAEALSNLGAEGISERPKEKGGEKGGEGSGSLDYPTGNSPEVEEQRARLRTRLMKKHDMGFGDWMARRNKLMKDKGLSLEEADAKLAKKLHREKL